MLAENTLVAWLKDRHGWRHYDGRVVDIGFAFTVSPQPDAYLMGDQAAFVMGLGPTIVLKRTGAVWGTGGNPYFMPLWQARTEEEFEAAFRRTHPQDDPARPPESVPFDYRPKRARGALRRLFGASEDS
ncbi:hypothetical protein OG453_38250 [Streptomyces sp. NBC_01381]|uniref:hypothetical protein n=1 Tax=Streptomyces sp. NBC_01381 TaxID=2903845 RepID=UPI00225443E0|nr:hypothetical protein [Streptomyces sp. NBC_01381]MCX4672431.1 hypothetical protein [Streptomyces sp. NBC_01381]